MLWNLCGHWPICEVEVSNGQSESKHVFHVDSHGILRISPENFWAVSSPVSQGRHHFLSSRGQKTVPRNFPDSPEKHWVFYSGIPWVKRTERHGKPMLLLRKNPWLIYRVILATGIVFFVLVVENAKIENGTNWKWHNAYILEFWVTILSRNQTQPFPSRPTPSTCPPHTPPVPW